MLRTVCTETILFIFGGHAGLCSDIAPGSALRWASRSRHKVNSTPPTAFFISQHLSEAITNVQIKNGIDRWHPTDSKSSSSVDLQLKFFLLSFFFLERKKGVVEVALWRLHQTQAPSLAASLPYLGSGLGYRGPGSAGCGRPRVAFGGRSRQGRLLPSRRGRPGVRSRSRSCSAPGCSSPQTWHPGHPGLECAHRTTPSAALLLLGPCHE